MRPARIEVVLAAPEQESIIANLFELYAHDFSEFHPVELGGDGRFGYPPLTPYWNEPDHYPFLINVDGELAGFALVRRDSKCWDVAEFFIVRGRRRRGVGAKAAHEIWRRFPGPWEVRVMASNRTALSFWRSAVKTFTGRAIEPGRVQVDRQYWNILAFESAGLQRDTASQAASGLRG